MEEKVQDAESEAALELWTILISQWSKSNPNCAETARILVYACPISKSLRSNAWFIMSGAFSLYQNHLTVYNKLKCANIEAKYLAKIEKDLPRTYIDRRNVT